MLYFLFTLLGFVLGSTLFAYWIPKLLKNIDICTLPDDHNPGVSNAFMYGGFLCGILSLICELAKGFIPVYLGQKYLDINSLPLVPASVVVIINPHSLRSILTFGFFAFNVLLTIKTASIQIGCFIIAGIVIYSHPLKHNNGPVRISILHQR